MRMKYLLKVKKKHFEEKNLPSTFVTTTSHNLKKFTGHYFSGAILNRFSKDMNQVDETLPKTLLDVFYVGFVELNCVGNKPN